MKFAGLLGAICLGSSACAAPALAETPSPDYADQANWLCQPGRVDACGRPLRIADLNPDGYGPVEERWPAADPPADCFYVYPTVSRDPGDYSDLAPGPEEQAAAAVQLAPFAGVCRTFAPLYRQATLSSLLGKVSTGTVSTDFDPPYADVLAAWRHYLRTRNQGRPFVLIGHSQGSIHLSRLLSEEIEGTDAHRRMLSALLIGFNVDVPEGDVVGGTFRRTPLCRSPAQTRCVVAYVSFRAGHPPPPDAQIGRTAGFGMTVACTNPARLQGGSAPLVSYWRADPSSASARPIQWSTRGPPPAPLLRTDGLVTAGCVNSGPAGYLAVMVDADPADARTDRIPGDVLMPDGRRPPWGLHAVDMNLALGNLVALVAAQAQRPR